MIWRKCRGSNFSTRRLVAAKGEEENYGTQASDTWVSCSCTITEQLNVSFSGMEQTSRIIYDQ